MGAPFDSTREVQHSARREPLDTIRGRNERTRGPLSRCAVVSLTKAAALELWAHGLRVVDVAPEPIDTPMLRSAATEWPPAIQNEVPLARIGEPGDVACAVVWLASAAASYITGAVVPVDGGFLAP